jgi:peptidoglycan/xylan/chitin deacetylase (PgdA/CDA1 family)/folate-dependent phosphoribosylglycinamide formyltransferase PurN
MDAKELKVVFLVGSDSPSTRAAIGAVCNQPGVKAVAVLLDTAVPRAAIRFKNLRRNVRREGYSYMLRRGAIALASLTEKAMDRVVRRAEALSIVRRAFPDSSFTLRDLCAKVGMPLIEAGNLNDPAVAGKIRQLNADLGIVLGTRILKRPTFSAPRLGSINLHKGSVPGYRGTPPGFWEIYNGEKSAGVTVHYVDDSLDTGDIVSAAVVEILPLDTPDTLLVKLHGAGSEALAAAVNAIVAGTAEPVRQSAGSTRPNSRPTYRQVSELRQRLPHWNQLSPVSTIFKNLYVLAVYYSGSFRLSQWLHRRFGRRAAVILYHRVNDISRDPLTAGIEEFAAQMAMVSKWYRPISTGDLVRKLRGGEPIPGTSVAIHFDDCYRDVFTGALPILRELKIPAAAFVNSAFVGTSRAFPHDTAKSPFRFENLSMDEIRTMLQSGFEIGAHTANHVDLGSCPAEEARREIRESVEDLHRITGLPVTLFSYPFGKERNIRREVLPFVEETGCECMFSAFGGFAGKDTDLFNIPRFGVSGMHHPLYVALEIEGLAPNLVRRRFRSWLTRREQPVRAEVPV